MGLLELLGKSSIVDAKEETIKAIRQTGFKATQKIRIGPVLLAIDENMHFWLVMDDRNPKYTPIHRFDQIKNAKIIKESQTVSNRSGASSRIMGVRVSSGQRVTQKVYTKLGVLVELDDLQFPTQYIDCISSPGKEETILSLIETMKDRG